MNDFIGRLFLKQTQHLPIIKIIEKPGPLEFVGLFVKLHVNLLNTKYQKVNQADYVAIMDVGAYGAAVFYFQYET